MQSGDCCSFQWWFDDKEKISHLPALLHISHLREYYELKDKQTGWTNGNADIPLLHNYVWSHANDT